MTTNFKLFSQTPLLGANFENLVIYSQDLINSGYFGLDSSGNQVARLPYLLLSRQIGNDGETYVLCQYQGTSPTTPAGAIQNVSFTISNQSGGKSSFQALLNNTPGDKTTPPGIFGGFIVDASGGAVTIPTNGADYKVTGYGVYLPYDYVNTAITINVGDYVWLRGGTSTTLGDAKKK